MAYLEEARDHALVGTLDAFLAERRLRGKISKVCSKE